jgi:hypothetical protein
MVVLYENLINADLGKGFSTVALEEPPALIAVDARLDYVHTWKSSFDALHGTADIDCLLLNVALVLSF